MIIKNNHPKQLLLFYYSDDFDEQDVNSMQILVDKLCSKKEKWVIEKPFFIDEIDNDIQNELDEPLRTVGGGLKLYSAHPPWDKYLPIDIDKEQYQEVLLIVEFLSDLSKSSGCEIVIELEGIEIGWIQNGIPDEGILVVFLKEWRLGLNQEKGE